MNGMLKMSEAYSHVIAADRRLQSALVARYGAPRAVAMRKANERLPADLQALEDDYTAAVTHWHFVQASHRSHTTAFS